MSIGGVSVILILGIVNFLLVLFQLSSGRRWIKVPVKVHRTTGHVLVFTAALHGLLAVLVH